jgi:nucleotide-binding universal stress UspA family protein
VPPTPDSTNRLVFGDDRSAGADLAWLWINSQPWPDWELVVLTAVPPPLGQVLATEESWPTPVSGPAPRPSFTEPGFASVEFLEARTDPRILLCQDHAASVVVVGPASQGLGPWHLGSTTEWLLLGPPSPILVARAGRPVGRVLVATDGSAHAATAIDTFLRLPLARRVDATVLWVDDGTGQGAAADEAAAKLTAAGIDTSTVRRRGRAHREILAEADSSTDLLVLGTRGVGGLDRLRLGSTASAVVRQAPCSVLVAHAPAPAG